MAWHLRYFFLIPLLASPYRESHSLLLCKALGWCKYNDTPSSYIRSRHIISFVYINLDRLFYFALFCSAHSFFPSLPFPFYPTCALLFSAQVLHRIRPMHLCPVHLHRLRETARTDYLQPCYRVLCCATLCYPVQRLRSHLISSVSVRSRASELCTRARNRSGMYVCINSTRRFGLVWFGLVWVLGPNDTGRGTGWDGMGETE